MADARQYLAVDGLFEMVDGTLTTPTVAYETWGQLDKQASNAVLLFTGLSPSAHAASSDLDPSPGWWEYMIGPGRPIDTDRYFVLCANSLGSCFGSTGPASEDSVTGEPYRLSFPKLRLEDIATSAHLVARHLGIEQVHTVAGGSMGGMTALCYALLYPGRSRNLLAVSSATRSLPFAIAMRSLQREIVRDDPNWQDGTYSRETPPTNGMRLARKLGMITYRSAEEWAERFGRDAIRVEAAGDTSNSFDMRFEVEGYLEDRAIKFANGFDPNCYLYLSRAMDLFDAADHGGSVAMALASTGLERAQIIGATSDILFPPEQQIELADGLTGGGVDVQFELLDAVQGHDSFLIDAERFEPVVRRFF